MAISRLHITNFRSYGDQVIELDSVVTLVVGPNATGKTNLLEALYVLATTKSFRAKDVELVRHGEDFFRLEGLSGETQLSLAFKKGPDGTEKRVRHDDTPRTLADHLGTQSVVLFEPNDLLLIHGGPDRRRRYLDTILSQTDRQFVSTLNRYRRVLAQRNRLLDGWSGQTGELFAWDVKLTELAAEIDDRRRQLIDQVSGLAAERYRDIAGSKDTLSLNYQGSCDPRDYATNFLQLLQSNFQRDIGAGFTTIGPHRDDIEIIFNGSPILSTASRGEMRSAVLALKLAELAYIQERSRSTPLLLLDDVFSELDDSRRHYLVGLLGENQAVITTTDADIGSELGSSHATIYTGELQNV